MSGFFLVHILSYPTMLMNSLYILVLGLSFISLPAFAQDTLAHTHIAGRDPKLPHQFREMKTGATLEAVRDRDAVKLYVMIDSIEQYSEVVIERSEETQTTYAQCKMIRVEKGKYPKNYVELTDRYPLSSKMPNQYRIKGITPEGIVRIFPAVPVSMNETKKLVKE